MGTLLGEGERESSAIPKKLVHIQFENNFVASYQPLFSLRMSCVYAGLVEV
jgi:hypothetical protein